LLTSPPRTRRWCPGAAFPRYTCAEPAPHSCTRRPARRSFPQCPPQGLPRPQRCPHQRMDKKSADIEVKKWAKKLKVEEYLEMTAEKLSKGNQQKIQFITAIMHDPELIVLDEPFSGLDPVNTEILKDVILELVDKGKYIVMSSHQMNSVEEFCQDIVILKNGKTILKGNLEKIKESYPITKLELDTKDDVIDIIKKENLSIKKHQDKKYIIELKKEEQAELLLEKLVEAKIKIERFELIRPTLHEIFIEKAGEE